MGSESAERRARRERQRLNAWAMRAADKINGALPHRAPHLGNLGDFAHAYPDWTGRTWESAYGYVLRKLEEIDHGTE